MKDPEIPVGYVPRIDTANGVFLGDAVVANRNGQAFLAAVNSNDFLVVIDRPYVFLEEIELLADSFEEVKSDTREIFTIRPDLRGPETETDNNNDLTNSNKLLQPSNDRPGTMTEIKPDKNRVEEAKKTPPARPLKRRRNRTRGKHT